MPLQRVITDFGADEPFARVNDKLREHYGFEVPVSCIRAVTLRHGEAMLGDVKLSCEWPEHEGVRQVIAQSDGSMVPVVSVDPESADKRKGKALNWREIRLCVARRHKSLEVQYGGNFPSGVEETGRQLYDCVSRAGFGRGTAVHIVGDGAGWIRNQIEEKFGSNGNFLVDFMHLSQYLSATAGSFCDAAPVWLRQQQAKLKANQAVQVLEALMPHLEAPEVSEEEAPVRKAYRYLHNRLDQVDYQGAAGKELPIGSGEVESAHRYVIQARLKRPGAWWSPASIDNMLALRLRRANRNWNCY